MRLLLTGLSLFATRAVAASTCANPMSLSAPAPNPDAFEYSFNPDTSSLVLTPAEFTSDPNDCTIIYSCATTLPAGGIDLCTLSLPRSTSIFDTTTGILTLTSDDPLEIPSNPDVAEY